LGREYGMKSFCTCKSLKGGGIKVRRIYLEAGRCLDCRVCEKVCAEYTGSVGAVLKVLHSDDQCSIFLEFFDEAHPVNGALGKPIPFKCRQCGDAPCVQACLTGAMRKDPAGVVTNLPLGSACVGCGRCAAACPEGIIEVYHPNRGRSGILRCDGCPGLEVPVCIQACPAQALSVLAGAGHDRETNPGIVEDDIV